MVLLRCILIRNEGLLYALIKLLAWMVNIKLILNDLIKEIILAQWHLIFPILMSQVRIHNFLERTKNYQRKKTAADAEESAGKEKEILRKRVNSLIKRKRLLDVQKLVKTEEMKPWGRDTQAKVRVHYVISLRWLTNTLLFFSRTFQLNWLYYGHSNKIFLLLSPFLFIIPWIVDEFLLFLPS